MVEWCQDIMVQLTVTFLLLFSYFKIFNEDRGLRKNTLGLFFRFNFIHNPSLK